MQAEDNQSRTRPSSSLILIPLLPETLILHLSSQHPCPPAPPRPRGLRTAGPLHGGLRALVPPGRPATGYGGPLHRPCRDGGPTPPAHSRPGPAQEGRLRESPGRVCAVYFFISLTRMHGSFPAHCLGFLPSSASDN